MAVNSRFSDAPWIDSKVTVIIGGAGGIGSWITLFLSRIGYKVRLYDFDSFEEHNMGGQFVTKKYIGTSKVNALSELITDFGGRQINTYNERFTYDNGMSSSYMIAAFDNMEARKVMFEKWFTYNSEMENKDALFIDGRLLMEQMQILCVTPENTKAYREKHLFDDSEVADEVCTLKQTSHSAAMVASLMTGFFTNHIANINNGNKARVVPFEYEYFIPLNLQSNELS